MLLWLWLLLMYLLLFFKIVFVVVIFVVAIVVCCFCNCYFLLFIFFVLCTTNISENCLVTCFVNATKLILPTAKLAALEN